MRLAELLSLLSEMSLSELRLMLELTEIVTNVNEYATDYSVSCPPRHKD